MTDTKAIARRIADVFQDIQHTRMADVPILNAALSVEVVGLQEWSGHWLCVLLTPWFMNLMLLPREAQEGQQQVAQTGETVRKVFPCGSFSFLTGFEEGLGPYLACSLFSPVDEFTGQEQAIEVAKAVMLEIMKPDGTADTEPAPDAQTEIPAPAAPAEGEAEDVPNPERRRLFGLKRQSDAREQP